MTKYGYDQAGRRVSVTDPTNKTTNFVYDSKGRLVKVIDPLGNETQFFYDGVGNKIKEVTPTGRVTEYQYDANNRLVKVIVDPGNLNLTTIYQYDEVGNKIAETDPKGRTTYFVYDERNRLVKIIDPQNGQSKPTVYEYDAIGNRVKVIDPEGRTVHYGYDALGRLVKLVRGDGTEERYAYDLVGNMVAKRKADGRVIRYEYDPKNRLVRRVYQGGKVHQFVYDALGRRVQMVDEVGMVVWQYDALGRVISVTQPVGSQSKTITYSYDAAGRRVQMVDAEGLVTSYSYDAAGRLVEVSNGLIGTTKFFYDGEGKLIRQENGNGTYANFSYDSAGRIVQIEYRRKVDNSLLSRFVYSYDEAGNRVKVQEEVLQPDGSMSVATVFYGYDAIDRLVSERRVGSYPYWYEYTYDGSGNRLSMVQKDVNGNVIGQKVYSYDLGNKLLQEVANGVVVSYQYDPNGNTISKIVGTSVVRYYWDDEDKMVRLEDSVVMNFKTDGLGFRRYKEVVGQSVTYFVYDLGASEIPGLAPLVVEYDQNGNLVAKYHHDGGGLLAMTRGNASYWHVFEAIGTVRQLTDSQSQVPDTYFYDAWGNELTSPHSQVPNPFRYVGKHGYYLDTQSALMLLGVRYYASGVSLFLSRDLVEGYGYTYAADNPVHWIDPRGLQHMDVEHCNIVNGQRMCSGSGVGMVECNSVGFVIGASPNDPSYDCYRKVCQIYKKCNDEIYEKFLELTARTREDPIAWLICGRTNRCLPDCGPGDPNFSECDQPGRAGPIGRALNLTICCVESAIRVCCWITTPAERALKNWVRRNLEKCKHDPSYKPSEDPCKKNPINLFLTRCDQRWIPWVILPPWVLPIDPVIVVK